MDGMVLPIPPWPIEKKVCGTWLKVQAHFVTMEQGNANEATHGRISRLIDSTRFHYPSWPLTSDKLWMQ